jgi:transposase
MASPVAQNVDDAGAFCNALKQSCFGDQQASKQVETQPVKSNDKPKVMSRINKGGRMTQEEFDEQLKQHLEKVKAELTKEYDYRVHKAREDAKAEAESASSELREEIRKLQSEKRSERIEGWLRQMKSEGKMAPAEESKVRALREWIPDEESSLKYFSLKDGKTQEHSASPAKLFESLFENRPSAFRMLSKDGTIADAQDEGQELEDAGAEVDRRAKNYQQKQQAAGTKVEYGKAVNFVLKADPQLANRYRDMSRH